MGQAAARFQLATVAVDREMTVLCWHLVTNGENCAFARPSLTAHKRRRLELAAGDKPRRGTVARALRDYHIKRLRDREGHRRARRTRL